MPHSTADLCDQFSNKLQIVIPALRSFGGVRRITGIIETVQIDEDNRPVIALLEQQGEGRVLVVDNRAINTCAVVGDRLAGLALKNGWAGIIVNGCVRDIDALATINIGLWALGTCPMRSSKRANGETGIPVTFAGVTFRRGDHLYADPDGIVTSAESLADDFAVASVHP